MVGAARFDRTTYGFLVLLTSCFEINCALVAERSPELRRCEHLVRCLQEWDIESLLVQVDATKPFRMYAAAFELAEE